MALFVLILLSSAAQIRACNDTEPRFGSVQDSHWCYECRGLASHCLERPVICPIGFSKCMSTTIILQIGHTPIKMKQKECIEDCQDSSMNYGVSKSSFTCCGTRLCNYRDAPDPRTNALNGRTCYYCDGQDCSKTVRCSGTEDRCITTTSENPENKGGPPVLLKGCASKYICGALKCSFIRDVSCCEGDLCNAEENVTQSFRSSAKESVTQSILQSLKRSGAKSVTRRLVYNDAQSVTDSIAHHHAQRVRQKVTYDDASGDDQRVVYNHAESVEKSFLFLCCSLLFYFLWL